MVGRRSVLEDVPAERCTGCGACVGSCPFGVLQMGESVKGFLTPFGTGVECRDCGRCLEICPALQTSPPEEGPPEVVASWATDGRLRGASASGGVFAELARRFLEWGGVVAGARYDGIGTVCHTLIDDPHDLPCLQGSKYVQSHAEGVYPLCLEELERGRKVLFSGTPCQVKAMRLLAEVRGLTDPLFCVDLVCYGVPSALFVRRYLGWLEKARGARLSGFLFRDNSLPWSSYGTYAIFEDGSLYRGGHDTDPFYRGFDISLRESCFKCPFNRFPRPGDLSLGDFWGIADELHDERGVSLVLLNSPRGRELLELTEGLHVRQRSIEEACRDNLRVDGRPLPLPDGRIAFFNALRESAFEEVIEQFL